MKLLLYTQIYSNYFKILENKRHFKATATQLVQFSEVELSEGVLYILFDF